jgi:hypothetical protein
MLAEPPPVTTRGRRCRHRRRGQAPLGLSTRRSPTPSLRLPCPPPRHPCLPDTLDADHTFEAAKYIPVCGNTAAMLQDSWLSDFFAVTGDRANHRGQFLCDGVANCQLSAAAVAGMCGGGGNAAGGCCGPKPAAAPAARGCCSNPRPVARSGSRHKMAAGAGNGDAAAGNGNGGGCGPARSNSGGCCPPRGGGGGGGCC